MLLNWKPLVKSGYLFKVNRFGHQQQRWFMLERNKDLSWYKDRLARTSRNAVHLDALKSVVTPSKNAKVCWWSCDVSSCRSRLVVE